jgi:Ribbon-helix-helix protein, copG family.
MNGKKYVKTITLKLSLKTYEDLKKLKERYGYSSIAELIRYLINRELSNVETWGE